MIEPAAPPAKRPRGRPRKTQPEIDPSQPLHPWASTSQQQHAPTPSTSYRPLQISHTPPPPHATSMQPPATVPPAVAPVPAASFYAQPRPQPHTLAHSAAYAHAAQAPVAQPEPQYVVPVPAPLPLPVPRQNVPTRADLEFLLGGPPKVRARSSTPNVAAVQGRTVSRASVAPAIDPYAATAAVGSSRSSASIMHTQYTTQTHEPIAGPSRLSTPAPRTLASYQQETRHPAPHSGAPARRAAPSAVFPGDETAEVWPGAEGEDDGFPLGAEAVMEPDQDARSSDADNEAYYAAQEDDDPNDRDFRPNGVTATKRRPRLSQASADGPAGAALSTPPQRGRRSLASSSTGTGKVAGSASRLDFDGPRRRGRPRNSDYTPDVVEKMKAANEILAVAMELPDRHDRRIRLDEIIDRKTRRMLSPEMRRALMRARNTQLQKERREKLRAEAEAAGEVKARRKSRVEKLDQMEPMKRKRLLEKSEEEAETGSGSAIVERARGKVSEWIKSISSEAEQSVELEDEAQVARQTPPAVVHAEQEHVGPGSATPGNEADADDAHAQPRRTTRTYQRSTSASRLPPEGGLRKRKIEAAEAATAVVAAATGGEVDPRLLAPDDDEQLVEGYFARFGTVTGKQADAALPASAQTPNADKGAAPESTQPFAAGIPGDEYYFSN